MDANSKLGSKYIEKDPHEQSRNSKLLADILDRHALQGDLWEVTIVILL